MLPDTVRNLLCSQPWWSSEAAGAIVQMDKALLVIGVGGVVVLLAFLLGTMVKLWRFSSSRVPREELGGQNSFPVAKRLLCEELGYANVFLYLLTCHAAPEVYNDTGVQSAFRAAARRKVAMRAIVNDKELTGDAERRHGLVQLARDGIIEVRHLPSADLRRHFRVSDYAFYDEGEHGYEESKQYDRYVAKIEKQSEGLERYEEIWQKAKPFNSGIAVDPAGQIRSGSG